MGVASLDSVTIAAAARSQLGPYTSFDSEGDVIHFEPVLQNLSIVYRVQFDVFEGEQWVPWIEDDPMYDTNYTCETIEYCPSPV